MNNPSTCDTAGDNTEHADRVDQSRSFAHLRKVCLFSWGRYLLRVCSRHTVLCSSLSRHSSGSLQQICRKVPKMEPSSKTRKRVREACENCRRKKGRCPGEKPTCSLCARLGQICVYAGDICDSSLLEGARDRSESEVEQHSNSASRSDEVARLSERRFQSLDDKVSEVLDQVRSLARHQQSYQSSLPLQAIDSTNDFDFLPSNEALRKAAGLYLKYCQCQPLPLFAPAKFEVNITSREPELCLAITATASRFSKEAVFDTTAHATFETQYRRTVSMVMSRIDDGKVELATLQTLCLLTCIAYNEGHIQKAGAYLVLLLELARSSRLEIYAHQSVSRFEEHTRCLWSIIMLQYLCGGLGLMSIQIDTKILVYPAKEASNDLATVNKQNSSTAQESDKDLGIVAYAIQMTEAWYRVRHYVHHRGKLDKQPPWSGQSLYSEIMSRQMELESQMPHKHRFDPSGFADHPISVLSTNRPYWAPWLYLQLIYHSIVCTLNHPLLLSNHLRRFRVNQIPELFLQHIGDMINSHTDWFIHLLDIAAKKQFELSDPFLGRCIAIIATIFLQQSYTEDQEIRADKRNKYQICLDQVLSLGKLWPHVQKIAIDLQRFEATVSKAFQNSSTNSPHLSSYVDMAAFWRIMDSHSASTSPEGAKSIFGPSLRLQAKARGESELLSTRLIPEPTRVHSLAHLSASNASTPIDRADAGRSLTAGIKGFDDFSNGLGPDLFSESPFLAENFFTLGQDFVGNADDWFNWTEVIS